MKETTQDLILDGKIRLCQSATGYRAGMDALFLAAMLAGKSGDHLVEFGCGPGAAMLCAAHRLPECSFTGIEIDADAVDLARQNIADNGMEARAAVRQGDIAELAAGLKASHVFFNPPFFDDPRAIRIPRAEKQRAWLAGDVPLAEWVKSAARVLDAKGRISLIHRADALAEILAAFGKKFGSVAIRPVHPRAGRPAKRILVTARLGGKAPLVILPGLVLHDGEGNSPQAEAILRGRAIIEMDA